jgi:hypothetical protein
LRNHISGFFHSLVGSSAEITATEIAKEIDDLGFPCAVSEDSGNTNEKVALLVRRNKFFFFVLVLYMFKFRSAE